MNTKDYIVITIDGPAGSGKSTVAKLVAARLSLLYVDTGAMYRAVAWKALSENLDITDERKVAHLAARMKIDLRPGQNGVLVFADGEEVTDVIRAPDVTDASSRIAAFPSVRDTLVKRQQAMGRERGVVMEGRDIGTVVFPDTPFKFYLDASITERARRRMKDLLNAGHRVTLDELKRQVQERDRRDMSREVGPLTRARDAILIDTTNMTIEEVVQTICRHVEARSGEAIGR
ncbi:MAG: (d)CMP kinase [Candidatus Abyssubacteria bacterium]